MIKRLLNSVLGALFMTLNNDPYVTLEHALVQIIKVAYSQSV